MIPEICKDCGHTCKNHADCLKLQDWNIVIDDARQLARLRQHIKINTPDYKGKNKELMDPKDGTFFSDGNNSLLFTDYLQLPEHGYRFTTITFDPKKFGFEFMTNPKKQLNFIINVLELLKPLFTKCYLIVELHKSKVLHAHINYSCPDLLTWATLQLRLKYYFAYDLRNKHAIHDRIFNQIGLNYMVKDESKLFKRIFTVVSNGPKRQVQNQT